MGKCNPVLMDCYVKPPKPIFYFVEREKDVKVIET